ncbi:MAG: S-layer homology domain-containing protein [Acidaminococcaceae bacterium]
MKKSLVLAMAMALGVSATAFAANPFSDVPAGHWAYASVAKLAAAGIVDGYPDGTFKGDCLMTRYEMAQIVAKAYAKGAIGADDKLMAEFADELDNLGVRVAKLEKKADNVKITGEARFGYKDFDAKLSSPFLEGIGEEAPVIPGLEFGNNSIKAKAHEAALRTRLYLSGTINDDWTYGAMIQNTQTLDSNAEESTTKFRRAYVNGKIGEVEMTAGRQAFTIGEGYVADLTGDAIKLDFGKKLKTTVFAGRFDSVAYDTSALLGVTGVGAALDYLIDEGDIDAGDVNMALGAIATNNKTTLYGANFAYDFTDKLYGNAGFYAREGHNIGNGLIQDEIGESVKLKEQKIYTAGLGYKFDKNVKLYGEYQKADKSMLEAIEVGGETAGGVPSFIDIGDDGWAATVYYKGANPMDKGSWGAYATYYDQSGAVLLDSICELEDNMPAILGMKGYEIGTSYTLAKNVVGKLAYYDLENKDLSNLGKYEQKMIWSTVTFNF